MAGGIKSVQTAAVAHGRADGQGLAAGPRAKVHHHLAALGVEQQGQELRAFVLHLDVALHKSGDFGQRGFAFESDAPWGIRRGLGVQACGIEFGQHGFALFLLAVDAQIQGCGLVQAGDQGVKALAHLGLERLRQPLGQVVAVLGQPVGRVHGVALGEPGFFGLGDGAEQKVALGRKTQDGQAAPARAAARTGQGLELQALAQGGVNGVGQGGAFARAEGTVFAEKPGHHGVGRVVKLEHLLDQSSAFFEEGFGVHGVYCPTEDNRGLCQTSPNR